FEETLKMYRSDRAMTLPALLPRLTEAESEHAVATLQIGGRWDDDEIPSDLAAVAPYLIWANRDEAIRIAREQILAQRPAPIDNFNELSDSEKQDAQNREWRFAYRLHLISGLLRDGELLEAFEIAMHLPHDYQGAESLIAMIPNLPDEQKREA